MKEITLKIDGHEVKVPEGTTVLEAAKKLNKVIPTFCYHPKLPIFGGCRMCLVYEKNWKRNIIACATPVYEGMEIETENPKTVEERKFILEMLFTRHPLDCPICDKAGECDLQNWGTYYGPQQNPSGITPFEKIRPEENWESEYFEFVSNRCVLCLKCISVCKNVVGADALFQEERGFEILISPDKKPMDEESSCEACGLCVDVCPVGAILFKPFKFNARAWLLKETVSYCNMCSLQCPVSIDHNGKDIYRVRSTADLKICAGAYLGYDIYKKNRLKGALENGKPVDQAKIIGKISELITESPFETALIVSPYSGNETLKAVKNLQEKTGIKVSSTVTTTLLPVIEGFKEETGDYCVLDEEDILNSEKIIIVGNDPSDTNPVISYLFHKNYNEGFFYGKDKKIIFVGDKLLHTKKYSPVFVKKDIKVLTLEDIYQLKPDKNSVIVYSTTTLKGEDAYRIGKLFGIISRETGSKLLILPQEVNAFGVINNLELYYLPDILKSIKDKKIKNLILIGEDIIDHITDEELQEIFMKVDTSAVITPFSDGLSLSCKMAIGCALWLEEEKTTEGFRGVLRSKKAIDGFIPESKILEQIVKNVQETPKALRYEERKEKNFYNYEGFDYPYISLWDFGYIGRRSDNLMNYRFKREARAGVQDGN
ncbi:NADH-quinone oxidoreductase subunit G [Persephonella hydrogeniphila]|uniref:NADH-quinone oxidoreductase subunit G n=1 Tax=Persephonella hydrogeniphila TaxID=198703 RepID=A0A285NHT8_9AQUI|nr:2Fe-2S iron-sulfur cluster-binding protein [Persephonella hydrogeniphila]SNZ09054.1 NADH-quinone oxidoreductase subunit G [Persephonella hydrogeniphila]